MLLYLSVVVEEMNDKVAALAVVEECCVVVVSVQARVVVN